MLPNDPRNYITLQGEYVGYRGDFVRWDELHAIAKRDKRVQDEIDRLTLEMGKHERVRGNRLSPTLQQAQKEAALRIRKGT